jgi:hypothetical protein
MTSLNSTDLRPCAGLRGQISVVTLPLFTATIFLSALLLFAIQPMFTKMVTPSLGGTPAVWSVAMVFFQAALLAGYAYAHGLARFADPRVAITIHVGVLGVAMLLGLPIVFDSSWGVPPAEGTAFWLLGVYAVSVGLPFFAIAANGPLLQDWFRRTGHVHAHDPYFLYAASNLGSMLALLAYPFLIEPMLDLGEQSAAFSKGFALLALAIGLCGAVIAFGRARDFATAPGVTSVAPDVAAPSGTRQRLSWIGLAFVPSALLVAVTAQISVDVAAVPLLWVIPLALFLLTFVLMFGHRSAGAMGPLLAVQPAAIALLLAQPILTALAGSWVVGLVLTLAAFFINAAVCHGALYARRPEARHLTEFYLFVSLGGVLGGIFASLLAPVLFSTVLEYPLMVVAALLARPGLIAEARRIGFAWVGAALFALALIAVLIDRNGAFVRMLPDIVLFGALGLVMAAVILARPRPVLLVAASATGFAMLHLIASSGMIVERTRSFFAVHVVRMTPGGDGHMLMHGNTVHGIERMRDAAGRALTGPPEPLSYYHAKGALGETLEAQRKALGGRFGSVAVIGLGAGAMACYRREGERWTFFEIDPEVVRIAREPRLFRAVGVCAPTSEIVIGDGRLTMAARADRHDLIVVDAFSSDSIPVHLLTREALQMYGDRLNPGGAILIHISNRHLLLHQTVANAAHAAGMVAAFRADRPDVAGAFGTTYKSQVLAMLVTPDREVLADLSARAGQWRPMPAEAGARPWTDGYSNILEPLLRAKGWR